MARSAWQPTAWILAMLANCNRDPKSTQPLKPDDFDRFAPPKPKQLITMSIRDLRDVLMPLCNAGAKGAGTSTSFLGAKAP